MEHVSSLFWVNGRATLRGYEPKANDSQCPMPLVLPVGYQENCQQSMFSLHSLSSPAARVSSSGRQQEEGGGCGILHNHG